jgi:AcrR family transcriptional regulator
MALKRLERGRQRTIAEIKQLALQQMAEQGEAALSLNAIARAMGMTTPALYRYFANRDALITALIVDAYQALADHLLAVNEATDPGAYATWFNRLAQAYRSWAVERSYEYALIFGTPIAGYHAPAAITVPAASRGLVAFAQVFKLAWLAGCLALPAPYTAPDPALAQTTAALLNAAGEDPSGSGVFLLSMTVRSQLHGLIWAELYQQLPPGIAEAGALYTLEVSAISERLGWGQATAQTE